MSYTRYAAVALLFIFGSTLLFAQSSGDRVESKPQIETEAGRAGMWSTSDSLSSVPGQFVIKYKDSVREPVESLLAAGRDLASAMDGGDDSLDRLHRRHDVLAARPVFRLSVDPSSAVPSITEIRLERENRLRSNGSTVPADLPDLSHVYVMTLGPGGDVTAAVEEFGRNPHVEYVHPNYIATVQWIPNDPFYHSTGSWEQTEDDLWGLKKLDTEHAWDTATGEGIVVAVNDTGLDRTHLEIAANVWSNEDEIPANGIDDDGNGFIDDTYGWNFVAGNNAPVDGHGHGTHVSGTIAAVGDNDLGIIGVAPRARILSVKGLDDGGSGSADNIAAGLVYAAENGADVINNSWGCSGPCPSVPVYEDAVRFAHGLGVAVVFSAGNKAADIIDYCPQNVPESIVVAASTQDDTAAYFTSFGFIDVTAPGGGVVVSEPMEAYRNILSLKSAVCNPNMCPDWLIVADNYLRQAGTSMSAPHVAGVAALILQVHPEYGPEQVRQALRRGADDILDPGYDFYAGYGRLNAAASVAEPETLGVLLTGTVPVYLSGTYAVDVHGLADGPGFESWSLEYGTGTLPTDWTGIAGSTISVAVPGLLAQWNVDAVPDGTYSLRLRAWNTAGEEYEDRHPVVLDRVVIDEPAASPLPIFRGGETIALIGTVAPPEFVSYGIRIQNSGGLWLADPAVTLAGDGLEKVVDGYLGAWDTTYLSADHYRIYLEVQLANGETIEESVQVAVDPALHEGWPITLGRLSFGMMTLTIAEHLDVADVNGDGNEDVLVGYGTTVRILDSSGQPLPGWPQTADPNERGGLIQKSPVVADLDGDGAVEIVAYNNTGEILVWNADGTPYGNWPMFVGSSLHSLAIADIDGDGLYDIIAAGWDRSVKVFDYEGVMLPGWPTWLNTGTTGRILSQPSVADLDMDGAPELVVPAGANLYVLRSDGSIAHGWPRIVNPTDFAYVPHSYPALADIDGDGDLEVVVGSRDGFVYAFHHDGTDVNGWPQSVPPDVNSPAIGDIDGDGQPEVVAGVDTVLVDYRKTSQIFAWNGDGTPVPGWPVIFTLTSNHTGSAFGFGAAALIDLDGDGASEIIASSDVNTDKPFALKAYHGDASPVLGFRRPTSYLGASSTNTAAAGDVDGDGLLELAWIDFNSRLYLWDLDVAADLPQAWPMYHHDARHTGARYELYGCVPPDGSDYISLFSNADCTGTESYDTSSFNQGFRCRPDLNEDAVCGTLQHTATVRSYMRQGVCVESEWPSGNVLSGLVRVHRDGCVPEASSCGDDLCDEFEDCAICPYDCGACTVCGNGICESPEETKVTCPKDCKGKPGKE